MSKYTARANLKHNGTRYAPGDEVEMDDAFAEPLVRDGILTTPEEYAANRQAEGNPTPAPEQSPEQTPENEQPEQSGGSEAEQQGGSNEQPDAGNEGSEQGNAGDGEQDPAANL